MLVSQCWNSPASWRRQNPGLNSCWKTKALMQKVCGYEQGIIMSYEADLEAHNNSFLRPRSWDRFRSRISSFWASFKSRVLEGTFCPGGRGCRMRSRAPVLQAYRPCYKHTARVTITVTITIAITITITITVLNIYVMFNMFDCYFVSVS